MKLEILALLVLCSCFLLLTQKTLGQEVDLTAGDYGENITPINAGEEDTSDIQENQATYTTLSEEDKLGPTESSGDNITSFEILAVPKEVIEPKVQLLVGTSTEIEYLVTKNQEDTATATLDREISKSEYFPNKVEEDIATKKNIASLNVKCKSQQNSVQLQSTDDAGIPLVKNLMAEEVLKLVKSLEMEDTTIIAVEVTEAIKEEDASTTEELTTMETPVSISNEIASTRLAETNSERTVTDERWKEIIPETETSATTTLCHTPGTFADENDCRSYFICSATVTNQLQKTQKMCPFGQAFDKTRLLCSRDLSPCADVFDCPNDGTFADPTNNSTYYWCVTSLLNAGYHIFHVKCGNNQIYTHELGKCFINMSHLEDLTQNYELYMSKSPDEQCVHEEVSILRTEEKVKLKELKLREKIQRKYEKELMKKTAKDAKELAKLQGISLEAEMIFNCTQAGKFAAMSESFFDYFVCLSKKGKYKAVGMKCVDGQIFSAAKGSCTLQSSD
ncbi:uncharacterized protein LOC129238253 [Anastrepha obliqua]|uniref:uncharacterized protein LOC129238253 n=1 Tax=Anastrepha obliqua TaxID=95512 RepID=UPI00240A37FA|nr:uncharacterized protein LOC129238253 [Anastrepha obliqua]